MTSIGTWGSMTSVTLTVHEVDDVSDVNRTLGDHVNYSPTFLALCCSKPCTEKEQKHRLPSRLMPGVK